VSLWAGKSDPFGREEMNVGVLVVTIYLNDSLSLKDKRGVLNALKDRIRNNFNVSVAEVDEMDKWQKAVLGVAAVSNDKKHVSGCLDKIVDFIEDQRLVTVLDHYTEIL